MSSTAAQGFIVFTDGSWAHLYGTSAGGAFTDGTEAEMYVRTLGGAQEQLFKSHEGKNIARVAVQLADGSIVTTLMIYDAKAGVVARWRGSERNITSVVHGDVYDINVRGLNIPVLKGTVIKLNAAD